MMSTDLITSEQLREYAESEAPGPPDDSRRPPFGQDEFARRLERIRGQMELDGIDVLVATAPETMCWLHGFSCRWQRIASSTTLPPCSFTVLHAASGRTFMIDTFFHEELARLTSCCDDFRGIPLTGLNHEPTLDEITAFLVAQLRGEGWLDGTVGLERWSCVPNPACAGAIEASHRRAGHRIADATLTTRAVRRLKSPAEIAVIERAQQACDAGLREVQAQMAPGMTELEAWETYVRGVVAAGGEPAAIHETVAVGRPETFLHAFSSRRRIEAGDYLHVDTCASVHHYHARATRVFSLGEPAPELRRLVEITAGAYDVVVETARIGMPLAELHRALLDYFRSQGLPDELFFAGGYELGIAFPPDWVGEFIWSIHDTDDERPIDAGHVTVFESVAYAANVDTLVFDESGARFLSSVPREILLVGA